MALISEDKIEILKGKIRNLFDIDNEEFASVSTMEKLQEYIKKYVDLPVLTNSLIAEIDKEIASHKLRIEQNSKRCDDLEAFKLELSEKSGK